MVGTWGRQPLPEIEELTEFLSYLNPHDQIPKWILNLVDILVETNQGKVECLTTKYRRYSLIIYAGLTMTVLICSGAFMDQVREGCVPPQELRCCGRCSYASEPNLWVRLVGRIIGFTTTLSPCLVKGSQRPS